jgi:Rieske Fe-S protein
VVSVPEADVPAEGALALPQHRVAVVRQGAEVLALDLTCTHLGCTVKATEQGFSCPCHGSRFGRGGDVLRGPAPRALRRLSVERRDGIIRVTRG